MHHSSAIQTVQQAAASAGATAGWSAGNSAAMPAYPASSVGGGSGGKVFRRYATTGRPLTLAPAAPPSDGAAAALSPATRLSITPDSHQRTATMTGANGAQQQQQQQQGPDRGEDQWDPVDRITPWDDSYSSDHTKPLPPAPLLPEGARGCEGEREDEGLWRGDTAGSCYQKLQKDREAAADWAAGGGEEPRAVKKDGGAPWAYQGIA